MSNLDLKTMKREASQLDDLATDNMSNVEQLVHEVSESEDKVSGLEDRVLDLEGEVSDLEDEVRELKAAADEATDE